MPAEIVREAPAEGVTEYIGTGPYRFQEWRQDQYVHLIRNDAYQSRSEAPSGFAGEKTAPTAELFFHFVPDAATRMAGVRTGAYDIADSIPTENYAELSEDASLTLLTKNSGALTAFFNTQDGLLANETLRQAVLAAMNNEDIMQAAFADPALYELFPGYLNPAQTQWSTDAGAAYYNQNDREKAAALLQEAGYNGETLTLLATQDYAEMYAATIVLQEQLRQAGFQVEIDTYDFPTFMEKKNDYTVWNIFVASTVYQLTPPQLLVLSPDFAGFRSAEAAELVTEIRAASTQEAAKEHWASLQTYLYATGAATVIGHYASLVATGAEVAGFDAFIAPIVWNAGRPE
jgi:peptide/nickel transport system substrate-binding protein